MNSERRGFEVEFRGITKRFSSVQANQDVSFGILPNSIHGVVGENGAGKSTIVKILYGLYRPDAGEIYLRGKSVLIHSPQDAIKLGVGMVHQHFMLVPTIPVWQNLILGAESGPLLKEKTMIPRLEELQRMFGFSLDLTARTNDLSVGQQQQVEILKILFRNASILILDEPTAVLTPQEVDRLFERLVNWVGTGKTVILITHKLREIIQFTHSVTIMRQGKVVETSSTRALTAENLAQKIIGRKMSSLPFRIPPQGSDVLRVDNLFATGQTDKLKGISFRVKSGEILGVAGVEGNGQRVLTEVLAKVYPSYQGKVSLLGQDICNTYTSKQEGLSVIPSDRQREALIMGFSVRENLCLGHHREERFTWRKWLSRRKTLRESVSLISQFDVRPPDPDLPVSALSGGNQQKVVIAREMSLDIKLLLAAHPTRGVDIGAMEFIHAQFLEAKGKGAAIVLISSELDELLALSDRIIVLYDGSISGEVRAQDATETQLGLWMTGGKA